MIKFKVVKKPSLYTFEYKGNKERPASDRMTAELVYPAMAERCELKTYRHSGQAGTEILYNDKLLLIRYVKKLTNVADEEKVYATGEDLALSTNALLYPLVIELRNQLINEDDVEPFPVGELKP